MYWDSTFNEEVASFDVKFLLVRNLGKRILILKYMNSCNNISAEVKIEMKKVLKEVPVLIIS